MLIMKDKVRGSCVARRRCLIAGGTRPSGSDIGTGCPRFAMSMRYMATQNSSAVSLPFLSMSARHLQQQRNHN